MNYNDFSKKDLVETLELIQKTIRCKEAEEVRDVLLRVKEFVGADYSICGVGFGNRAGLYAPPMLINGDYPVEWLNIYGGEGLYNDDPLIRHNVNNPGAQLWEETYELYGDSVSPKLFASRDFGLKHGLAGGVYHEGTQLNSVYSFSASSDRFGRFQQKILDTITPHLHQALARVFKISHATEGEQLSEREREIIHWVKSGKTNWEISVILEISERTVKFHVQNIERKLGAVNKAHAVALWMEREQAC